MTYISVADFKSALSLTGMTFADSDIDRVLASASKVIDRYCGRTFTVPAAEADDTVRVFEPTTATLLIVDDVQSVTEVAHDAQDDGTYGDVRSSTTWRLGPLNALADGAPYTQIRSDRRWHNRVRVTGQFGWAQVPPEVVDATLMLASSYLKREREAPFGIASFGTESGSAMRLSDMDWQVKGLLNPLRRGRRMVVA